MILVLGAPLQTPSAKWLKVQMAGVHCSLLCLLISIISLFLPFFPWLLTELFVSVQKLILLQLYLYQTMRYMYIYEPKLKTNKQKKKTY